MAAPIINNLPTAPSRGETQTDFNTKANAFVDALQPLVNEINSSNTWVNTTVANVESNRVLAQTAATNASASESQASVDAATATAKAAEASNRATSANDSATSASASAASASASASTATTKAAEANASASSASTSASTATAKAADASTSANNAASSANLASTKAIEAGTSANQASGAAANAAVSLGNYRGDWSSGTIYTLGQSVSYGGSIWIAKTTTSATPAEGASWLKGTGGAALRDVTVSPTDTTAGRLLKVGDGGINDDDFPFEAFHYNPVVAKSATANAIGGYKIRLPYMANSNIMVTFQVDLMINYFRYTYTVSGYLYSVSNNWYLPKVIVSSNGVAPTKELVFGRDADGYAYVSVVVGTSYTGITVRDLTQAYSSNNSVYKNKGWLISAGNLYAENPVAAVNYDTVLNTGNTGTAVLADVTTSSTDTTAGRLLTTGATINQLDLVDTNIEFVPSVKPTLDFDFVNETYTLYDGFGTGFVQKPLADAVTFARTTEATGVDPIGRVGTVGANVPRLVFEDGVGKGYLSEESRTNLLTNSEFPNGLSDAPSRSGLVTLDTMDYGAGSVNAIAFGYDGVTQSWIYKTNHTPSVGTIYTLSILIEMSDGLEPLFSSSEVGSVNNDFFLYLGNLGINPLSYSVDKMYENTYRVSASTTSTSTTALIGVRKLATNSPRTFKVTGYQLEARSFSTSYIKTLDSTVTRTADSMSRTLGQEWNPNEGTFVVEFDTKNHVSGQQTTVLRSVNSDIHLWCYITGSSGITAYDGVNAVAINGMTGTLRMAAISSTKSSMSISVNGSNTSTTVSNGNLLTMTGFNLGVFNFNDTIKRVTYYPKAFDAATLQKLSRTN